MPSGEGIGWAVQADELLPALDALGISYATVGATERLLQGKGSLIFVIAALCALGFAGIYCFTARSVKDLLKEAAAKKHLFTAHSREKARPLLRGLEGHYRGSSIYLDEKPVIIGRDPHECNLVYPQSSFEISRCHCVVRFNSLRNEFTLEDSGSTNGTFIVPNEGDKPKRIPSGRQYSMGSRAKFYVGNPRNLFEVRR